MSRPETTGTGALIEAFVARLDRGADRGVDRDAAAEALAAAVDAGRAAWPDVDLEPEALARHLGEKVAGERDPVAALRRLRAGDLYLACACAAGDGKAIAHFERDVMPRVGVALRRLASGHAEDEVKQQLRIRVLTGDPPRIAGYSGRGDLVGWLRVAAVRTALNLRRSGDQRPIDEVDPDDFPAADADPELRHLRDTYRAQSREAFVEAFAALEKRQRNLLRQHFLDGALIQDLAALHRVRRVTAARWLNEAREQLVANFRAALSRLIGGDAGISSSVAGLIEGDLQVSLRTLFRTQPR
jgi:RNA polymerase sigma-70 factor (ECF subfamily)